MSESTALELGRQLRAKRESQGLSLLDVAEQTKILPKYLESLEHGEFRSLPGPTYAWLFLRTYAQLLKMNVPEIRAAFEAAGGAAPRDAGTAPPTSEVPRALRAAGGAVPSEPARVPATLEPPATVLPPAHPAPSRTLSMPPEFRPSGRGSGSEVWMWAAGIAVLALVAWGVWWMRRPPSPPEGGSASTQVPGLLPRPSEETLSAPPPEAHVVAPPSVPTPPSPAHASTATLRIAAKEPTWLEVTVDHGHQFSLLLQGGDERAWEGKKVFRLWIGNPSGVRVLLNDAVVELKGNPKEPLRYVDVFPDGRVDYVAPFPAAP